MNQETRSEMAAELRKSAHKDRVNAAYTLEIEKTIDEERQKNADKIAEREKEHAEAEAHANEDGISKGERKRRKVKVHDTEQILKGLHAREESWSKKKQQGREQARQLLQRAEAYDDKADYIENLTDETLAERIKEVEIEPEPAADTLPADNEEQDHGEEKE